MNFKSFAVVALVSLLLAGCGGSPVISKPETKTIPVTFYGDSLTQFWNLGQSFPSKPYTNDGHFGFTAVTLASDFDSSVASTHPGMVVILAGTNDVLQGDNSAHIFSVLISMYDSSRNEGIPFVICTIPPMASNAAVHNAVIVDVNAQLRTYAAANKVPLADYYAVLVDPASGELQPAFSADNIHLTQAGYDAITPVARKALQ